MHKKFLIPVVDVEYIDEDDNKVYETKRAIEEDSDGKKFIRIDGQIIYLEEDE